MKKNLFIIIFILCAVVGIGAQTTPTASIKPSVISGDVVAISAERITINSKTGNVDGVLSAKTEFKRVDPAKPDLAAATPAAVSDIAVGDRVMATGVLDAEGKSFPARSVYLMSKSAIAQKNAKEAEMWRTRGIAGKVTAVNAQTNQITVEVRGLMGTTSTVLTPKGDAKFKRYAPNSIRFDQAVDSSIADVKQGDMIRALGDKSSDGTSFSAEQIVTGAFQTIAGTVKSVDTAKNEIVITNLQTKKDVTVELGSTSIMKKFPAEMAERLAGGQFGAGGMRPPGQGGVQQGQPGGQPSGQPAGGQPGAGAPGQGRPGMGGGRGSGGIDDMLERFPNITAADLKAGDMIAISSTRNGDMTKVNAIKLLAGVEPFLRMAQAQSGGGRGGRGLDGGFSIPGLDGIGFP